MIKLDFDEKTKKIERKSACFYMYKKQNGICHLCGRMMEAKTGDHPMYVSYDHVIAKGAGGKGLTENTKLAHKWCNSDRGVIPVEIYKQMLDCPIEKYRRSIGLDKAVVNWMKLDYEREKIYWHNDVISKIFDKYLHYKDDVDD